MDEKTTPNLCVGNRSILSGFSLRICFRFAAAVSLSHRHLYCSLNSNLALGEAVIS